MKIILAVSGGVDSVVMLDLVCHQMNDSLDDIIVAHFNHGMRDNAELDEIFVKELANSYSVKYCAGRAEAGTIKSEEAARAARYDFLRGLAVKYNGVIYTAHHLDDLIETILINFVRGTGWRGLAVLGASGIKRPFLDNDLIYEPMDKVAIFEYAAKRRLKFREDQSNSSDEFLRNRLRQRIDECRITFEQKLQIYDLWKQQKDLKNEIDQITQKVLPEPGGLWERDWFSELDHSVAIELLRAGTIQVGISATRPQLEDFLEAILNYTTNKQFNLPKNRLVTLGRKSFRLDE